MKKVSDSKENKKTINRKNNKKEKSQYGSVTIFLAIIIVPMLIFAFTAMDICKIYMARDSASQATDLALNAGLSSFDSVLKDMYGLMATSSTEEELTEKIIDYYVATLNSSRITVDESGTVQNIIKNLLNSGISEDLGNNNNLLNVSHKTSLSTTGICATPIAVSSVSNPDVMHKQIVDYMKYRAPVYLVTGMLDKINVFKDLSNQTNATNAKLEFEETLSDINNSAIEAYCLFQLYFANNTIAETGTGTLNIPYPDEKTAKGLISKYQYSLGSHTLSSVKNGGYGLPDDALDSLARAAAKGRALKYYFDCFSSNQNKLIRDKAIEIKENVDTGLASEETLIENLRTAAKELTNYVSDDLSFFLNDLHQGANTWEKTGEKILTYMKDYYNDPQAGGYDTVHLTNADLLLQYYAPFYSGSSNLANSEFYTLCKKFFDAYNKAYSKAEATNSDALQEEIYSNYDNNYYSNFGTANDIADKIIKICTKIEEMIPDAYKSSNNDFTDFSKTAKELCEFLDKQIQITEELTHETTTNLLGQEKKNALDTVYDLFVEATKKAAQYSSAVDQIQTDNVRSGFNAQYVNDAKDIKELDLNDKNQLVKVLKENAEVYTKIRDGILSIEVFGEHVINFSAESGGKKKYVLYDNISSLIKQTPTSALKQLNPVTGNTTFPGNISISYWIDNNKQDIYNNNFYKEIVKIGNVDDNNTENTAAKEQVTNISKDAKEDSGMPKDDGNSGGESGSSDDSDSDFKPNSQDTFDKYVEKNNLNYETEKGDGSSQNISCDVSTDKDDKDVSSSTKDLLSSIGSYFEDLAKAARDDLYITEYLTNNFSCLTDALQSSSGEYKNTDKMMLSGQPFVTDGNANVEWFGAELEYILYGMDTKLGNQAAASGVIFAIRFVLNLIYSFTDAEIRSFTLAAATAACVGPLAFAVPLVQAVLHIGLSMAESAYDLMRLLEGSSVPIFKSQSTWVCKGTGVVRKIGTEVLETVSEKVIDTVSEEIIKKVEEVGGELTDSAVSSISEFEKMVDEEIDAIKEQVENDIIAPFENVIRRVMNVYGTAAKNMKDQVQSDIEELIKDLETNLGIDSDADYSDNLPKKVEAEVLKYMRSNAKSLTDTLTDNISNFISTANNMLATENDVESFTVLIKEKFSDLFGMIETTVSSLSGKVKEKVTEAIKSVSEEVQKGVTKGADKVKTAIQNKLNKSVRGHEDYDINYGGKASNTAMLSMDYKEYLYLFTVIGLACNESNMLQRAAVLMEANCKKNGAPDDYDINKAYTLIEGKGYCSVPTVFYGAVFKDGKWEFSGSNKYEFSYRSFAAY